MNNISLFLKYCQYKDLDTSTKFMNEIYIFPLDVHFVVNSNIIKRYCNVTSFTRSYQIDKLIFTVSNCNLRKIHVLYDFISALKCGNNVFRLNSTFLKVFQQIVMIFLQLCKKCKYLTVIITCAIDLYNIFCLL